MDPLHLSSLVASSVGVVRLGHSLRQLQKEFSGALDHVDTVAQQTKTIDFAISEISSLLHNFSNTFPPSFQTRLKECTGSIDKVVGQIQEHTQYVQTKAQKSRTNGRLLHLLHSDRVEQWEKHLGVQIQALQLVLQVAHLRSNDERTSVLEQESSKKLFERASSMSAKIGTSSSPPATKSFSFDPSLLQTKVYRRACEWLWRREITIRGDEIGNGNSSLTSVSSNEAIASEAGDSIERRSFSVSGMITNETLCPPVEIPVHEIMRGSSETRQISSLQEAEESSRVRNGPLQMVFETSTSGTTQVTTDSSNTNPTETTLATTISSFVWPKQTEKTSRRSGLPSHKSVVLVEVETAGSDYVDLPDCNGPDYYELIQRSMQSIRDKILAAARIEPSTYQGVLTSCTIETSGQAIDKFQYTATFLAAALEKMDEGFYASIEIIAHFSSSNSTNNDHFVVQTTTVSSEKPASNGFDKYLDIEEKDQIAPHFVFKANERLPFSKPVLTAQGGYGQVYKVEIYPAHRHCESRFVAVKRLHSSDPSAFRRESEILRKLAANKETSHIINLLATYTLRGQYHFLFPWAGGTLRDFWKKKSTFDRWNPTSTQSYDLCFWMMQQCAGIADGVRVIHDVVNQPSRHSRRTSAQDSETFGAHHVLKPENILWFSENDTNGKMGLFKISDFGISRFHDERGTQRANCSLAYRAPEYDLERRGIGRITSAYDIWSMGCIFLEFIVWLLCDSGGVNEFYRSRRFRGAKDAAFFIIEPDGTFHHNPSAAAEFQKLEAHVSDFDLPMREIFTTFLAIIRSCLEINKNNRPRAESLAIQLKELYKKMESAMGDGVVSEDFRSVSRIESKTITEEAERARSQRKENQSEA